MSVSKLEALPNEILSDILDNYMNGIELLKIFNNQLNQRFHSLFHQLQHLSFDFIQCHQNDFRFCLNLLPLYVDRIEELAISDEKTPGQVNAFLSLFPSLAVFTKLRTLYLHANLQNTNLHIVSIALRSLYNMSIHTLAIKIENIHTAFSSTEIISNLFLIKTLRKLSIMSNYNSTMAWDPTMSNSSNIESLTISTAHFDLNHLECIMQYAPRLKYLNIGIISSTLGLLSRWHNHRKKNITPMSALRTLKLAFAANSPATLMKLTDYFNCMPVLNNLEIKAHSRLLSATDWQMLFETSLPLLTSFHLRTTTSRLDNKNIDQVLRSFQNSYWTAKDNFNIMVTEHIIEDLNDFESSNITRHRQWEFDLPIIQCWMAPTRTTDNNLITINLHMPLTLYENTYIVKFPHYFNHLTCLIMEYIDEFLFKWIISNVNCSHIMKLDVTRLWQNEDKISSLIMLVVNIKSLHIRLDQAIKNVHTFTKQVHHISHVDISCHEHSFTKEDIAIIGKCFPCVKQLQINTPNLVNVPILKVYLLHLRTLTFKVLTKAPCDIKKWKERLEIANFSHQYTDLSVTIWIEPTVFEKYFWKMWCCDA